jgi:uncharacterized protein with HEPN domain
MSDKGDELRFVDIIDQIDFIAQSIAGRDFSEFLANREFHQSVAFSLQVIGEAANNLSAEAKAKAPAVPWPKIVALRHRIVHGYFALQLSEIWRIATTDAPALKVQLSQAGLIPND